VGAEPVAEQHEMTAAELFVLPGDGERRELIDGELHVMSPAGVRHGLVADVPPGLRLPLSAVFEDLRQS